MVAQTGLATPMLDDILRQPATLQSLLARRENFHDIARRHLAAGPGGRIHAFGCGDGWFAARAVAASLPPGALQAATSLDMAMAGPIPAADRAIAISMSGSVDRTNEAARHIVDGGGQCIALSNDDGGALGRITGAVAPLLVPDIEKFLTGTTRYSATLLGLMMLLDSTGSARAARTDSPALRAFIETDLPRTLLIARRDSQALAQCLIEEGLSGLRLLGAGPDWANADYGAAKLLKFLDLPIWSGEIEEFAHSQFWGARTTDIVILLASFPAGAALAENTAAALRQAGLRCLAIESAGIAVPSARWRMVLPPAPPWIGPLAISAALQMLAYEMALAMGGAPDLRQDIADPGRFRAAQMLSRRCELVSVA